MGPSFLVWCRVSTCAVMIFLSVIAPQSQANKNETLQLINFCFIFFLLSVVMTFQYSALER